MVRLEDKCEFVKCLKKNGNVNYAKTNFHAVTFKPVSGASRTDIDKLFKKYRSDLKSKHAVAGSFGVEGSGATQHVHIAFILKEKQVTLKTRKSYHRLLYGNLPYNKDLIINQPATHEIRNYTVGEWLAFPLKSVAKGLGHVDKIKTRMFNSGRFAFSMAPFRHVSKRMSCVFNSQIMRHWNNSHNSLRLRLGEDSVPQEAVHRVARPEDVARLEQAWRRDYSEDSREMYSGLSLRELNKMATEIGITDEMLSDCGHVLHKSTYICAIRIAHRILSDSAHENDQVQMFKRAHLKWAKMNHTLSEMEKEKDKALSELHKVLEECKDLKFELARKTSVIAENQTPVEQEVSHLRDQLSESNSSNVSLNAMLKESIQLRFDVEAKYEQLASINRDLSRDLNEINVSCRKRALSPDEWSDDDIRQQYAKRQKLAEQWVDSPPEGMNPYVKFAFDKTKAKYRTSYDAPGNITIRMGGSDYTLQEFKAFVSNELMKP